MPTTHRIESGDSSISVIELTSDVITQSTVVMLHGLRDSAWALLPIAEALNRQGHRVLLMELRGHGQSARSDAYAMSNFLLDVFRTTEHFELSRFAIFGHSLGGHIAAKFSALFPEMIHAAILVEGMGPPARPHEGDEAATLTVYRQMLLQRGLASPLSKPLSSVEDAAVRLKRNNPRLATATADTLALKLTTEINGSLHWAFDARAASVFLGTSATESQTYWRHMQCPTCVVSGTLSYEYWGREMSQDGFSGHFAEGEMESRAALIPNHEHHWFEHSGHMVHYDEPDRLAQLCVTFLEQHHE